MSETVLQLLDSLHANLLAKVSTDAHAHTWDVHKLHLGMSMACSIKLICMQLHTTTELWPCTFLSCMCLLLEHLALLAAAKLCCADCVEADGNCDSCGVVNQ